MTMGTVETCVSEKDVREALKLYYSRFGTSDSVTINEAAALAGIRGKGAHMHYYITEHTQDLRIGMPEDRKEALRYLKRLSA
jgi:hypothetical protein